MGDDGSSSYGRRKPDDGGFQAVIGSEKNPILTDIRWIVPYTPLLLKTFESHSNVEFCNSVKSIMSAHMSRKVKIQKCLLYKKQTMWAKIGKTTLNRRNEESIYQ